MKTTITGRKVTLKDSFKERVDKKLEKVSRFFSPEAEAAVTVQVEKGRQTVEVTIRDAGMIFRAEETAPDMLDALEKVMDVLVRRIRKNKTRLEKRMKESDFSILPFEEEEGEIPFEVVKSKSFYLRPMNVEEAILQMNLLEHLFFVFLNVESGLVNVVYRRNDGNYGLIEAAED